MVTINARKALEGEYPEATARYTLYLTTKPRDKAALVKEQNLPLHNKTRICVIITFEINI